MKPVEGLDTTLPAVGSSTITWEGAMDERDHGQQVDPAILRLARLKGRQLAGKYGFARYDEEDIQQDLLLDYLQRASSFDPHRCNRRTFARRVFDNRVATIIEAQKAACRDYRRRRISLDQSPDRLDGPQSPRLDQVLLTVNGACGSQSLAARLNRKLDVERTLIRLPVVLLRVCRLLMAGDTAAVVADTAGTSRATVYRRLELVRAAFVKAGFGGAPTEWP